MKKYIEFISFPGPRIGTGGTHRWDNFKLSETYE
jgi:hypothetical protein